MGVGFQSLDTMPVVPAEHAQAIAAPIATALADMQVLELTVDVVREVPVILDNLRHLLRLRRRTIYQDLPQIDPTSG